MAVLDFAHEDLSKPPLPQFIIALFLAKSKPAVCSVSDYVGSLRARIKEGRRPNGLASVENHVDSAAFWHDAFEKSEKTQLELRERILHLEWLQGNTKSGSPSRATSQSKRKRSIQSIHDVTNAPSQKRSRITAVDPTCKGKPLEFLADEAVWSASEQDESLLNHFYTLQQLHSQEAPDLDYLAVLLSQISSKISRTISSGVLIYCHSKGAGMTNRNTCTRARELGAIRSQAVLDHNLDGKFSAIGRMFPYLLKAIRRLGRSADVNYQHGCVIHSFVGLFREFLDNICNLSVTQARFLKTKHSVPRQTRQRNNNMRRSSSTCTNSGPTRFVLKLCSFLVTMASACDLKENSDKNIMDGFSFFLLDRVGTALKLFVFGDDSDDITSPKPLGSLGQLPTIDPITFEERRQEAEAQAPYLIHLLERTIPLMTRATAAHLHNHLLFQPLAPANAGLARAPSITLQSTLLTAIFGPEDSTDVGDGLRKPGSPDVNFGIGPEYDTIVSEKRKFEEGETGDWFKAEVWRILGWEVLAGRIAWSD